MIMKTFRSLTRAATLALAAAGIFASQATAMPLVEPSVDQPLVLAANDCYAIGQQIAAQNGG
ncbi:MAG: hypothetical protein E5X92_06625, partial [Mesorhizobium sp.]